MRVVESLSIFFKEPNDRVVDPCHLRYEACKLDVLNHSQVGLSGFFGQLGSCRAPYDHPYISYRQPKALILSLLGLLLGWICSSLTNKPL